MPPRRILRESNTIPYRSQAQRRLFHSPMAKRKGISAKVVKEFDDASREKKLPKRSLKHTRLPKKGGS